MMTSSFRFLILLALLLSADARGQETTLPPNVKVVWDMSRAWQQTTPTRQRICINGLWQWQPASDANQSAPPTNDWGYFKVPGCWPGITDYLQKDSQTVFANSKWKNERFQDLKAAWYQREIEIPKDWTNRRITLSAAYINSLAIVFVDGKQVGTIRFPAGEVDLSAQCQPGQKHVLAMLVKALPLKDVMTAYRDTANARQIKGEVPRRGLCGDVYLIATPTTARISDVKLEPSVRKSELTIDTALDHLAAGHAYVLKAVISDGKQTITEFSSGSFAKKDAADGHFRFTSKWKPDHLWDIDAPQNQYTAQISLTDAKADVLDVSWPTQFGFREFWIDGKDFYLNGSRIYLSAVPIDNAQIGAASANYAAVHETLERLKRIGINLVYTHNYDCLPGSYLEFDELLRAADDVGMLVSFTQPHFAQYDWTAPDADQHNGYADHAAFYVREAENHPSVVFYSMSHNATGYDQDMDPDLIDGIHAPREQWGARNAKFALRAEAIVHHLDPTRIVYHHAGGNIGSMHTINFYPNFAPVQELSDWFAHWADTGVKPVFLCEYGAPFTWDWTMYRGFYQGKREFGSAPVPWEFCLAEWDAQFLGDRAFTDNPRQDANLRWEAAQFAAGKVWHRWDYPTSVGSAEFEDRNQILATYLTDNWRAYRTSGVSGISPWEYEIYWLPREGLNRGKHPLKVDWDHLQQPGVSPDYLGPQADRMDTDLDASDWFPTAAGKALLRNNQPVLAYIAGDAKAFTSKDHDFHAGQAFDKQLIIINNSRKTQTFSCDWSLDLPEKIGGRKAVAVETGQQARIPLHFELPASLRAGQYTLEASVKFGNGERQDDQFMIDVLPAPIQVQNESSLLLFDPKGETAALLDSLHIGYRRVDANVKASPDQTLVIGKMAMTTDGPAPDISAVRDGLKVIVFEQSTDVLEHRLGFRVTEYGLRQVFTRIENQEIFNGVPIDSLHDWNGEATTTPPRLSYELRPQHGPTVQWSGIPVSRLWRCGNRGNVASVLIEKPARGDFLPIIDGGFDLQFSPLMQYREGSGTVIFCQLDVTGRTRDDAAARNLTTNLFHYVSNWKPEAHREPVYLGDSAGAAHLKAAGVSFTPYDGGALSPEKQVLIIAHGFAHPSSKAANNIASFIKSGGRVLAVALDQEELNAVIPFKVKVKLAEHVSAMFSPQGNLLAGVGPADVYDRAPHKIPLISGSPQTDVIGDGVLAQGSVDSQVRNVIFFQLAPWQFDYEHNYGLKRTYRRVAFTLDRIISNMGINESNPLISNFHSPLRQGENDQRWLNSYYLDQPQEWDDPYRHFRW